MEDKQISKPITKKPVVKRKPITKKPVVKRKPEPVVNVVNKTYKIDHKSHKLLIPIFIGIFLIATSSIFLVVKSFTQIRYVEEQRQKEMKSVIKFLNVQSYMEKIQPNLKKKHDEIFNILHLIYQYSDMYGVDPYLSLSVASHESWYFSKPNDKTLGKAGEIGYYQIMPPTAKLFGYTTDDLKNVEKNIRLGIYYLSLQLKYTQGGTVNALRMYNGGRGGIYNPKTLEYSKEVLNKKQGYLDYITSMGTKK